MARGCWKSNFLVTYSLKITLTSEVDSEGPGVMVESVWVYEVQQREVKLAKYEQRAWFS